MFLRAKSEKVLNLTTDSKNNLNATEANNAAATGRRTYITEFKTGLSLNFLSILETITTKTNDGSIIDIVAHSEPKTPAVLKPAKVATFKPTGPGVMLDIASIWDNSLSENQL